MKYLLFNFCVYVFVILNIIHYVMFKLSNITLTRSEVDNDCFQNNSTMSKLMFILQWTEIRQSVASCIQFLLESGNPIFPEKSHQKL